MLVLLVSFLIGAASAVDFGASANVYANKWTEITYINGIANIASPFKLNVYSDVDTTITFSAYANASATFDVIKNSGYRSLTISASGSAGYSFTSENTNAKITVTLTFPALDLNLAAQLALGVDVGLLKLDVSGNVNARIPVTYDTKTYVASVNLPEFTGGKAIYLTAAINKTWSASLDIGAKAKAWVAAWANQTLTWSCDRVGDLSILLSADKTVNIEVTPVKNTTWNVSSLRPLNVWFKVELDVEAKFESTIKYKYTDAQIQAAFGASADVQKLRLAYYDTTKAVWVFPQSGYSVDVDAKVVAQVTNHFSDWGVYYSNSNMASNLNIQTFTLLGLIIFALTFAL